MRFVQFLFFKHTLEQGAVRYYIKGEFSYLKFREDLIELANRE